MDQILSNTNCYHCELSVPNGINFQVNIDGIDRAMCCAGCMAVAETIVASGLEGFYRNRTAAAPTVENILPDFLQQVSIYDEPELQKSFVSDLGDNQREAILILEGITCPACVWVNEQHLKKLPGIIDLQANFSTRRLHVQWDESKIKLSNILNAVHEIGYTAHPYDQKKYQNIIETERKQLLKRLGLAGVLGMQVMMIAIALYTGDFSGEEEKYKHFLQWISLLLTIPVILYSSRAFFDPAIRDLKYKKLGMDVPVSLGILIAFIGSVKSTITGTGEVYFDSVVMFNFFLLTARYLELIARKRASETSENLIYSTPTTATRIKNNLEEIIPVARLEKGDRVLIRPGEIIPADGYIVEGQSSVDESLLTGESLPVARNINDKVIGGSINVESPLQVIVESIGQDSLLSRITSLMEKSQMEKPEITKLADRIAIWFVPTILCLTAVITSYWWFVGNPKWFEIMLSMLVVTCPCALSLATPTAITVATDSLMKLGVLGIRGHAIETLAKANHFIFDKTGTLTEGKLELKKIEIYSDLKERKCLQIAATLERYSEHPISKSILKKFNNQKEVFLLSKNVINIPGSGFSGMVEGEKYIIGNAEHIRKFSNAILSEDQIALFMRSNYSTIFLADENKLIAVFVFEDTLRSEALEMVNNLKTRVKNISLFSGDSESVVKNISDKLLINNFKFDLSPDQKLKELKKRQKKGDIVAMVGDGINDAPILAGAQVSIAMGSGAEITRANSDLILLRNQLPIIVQAIDVARKTVTIIKQNFAWAILYNLLALPLAMMGLIAPWMAAIGMSLSSLIVVTNALRIKRAVCR